MINPVEKMYTIFSAVLRQQAKSDVMTCFGNSARSAVYYQAGSPFVTDIFIFCFWQNIRIAEIYRCRWIKDVG
jgi:hypothetical protein